jgi:hypothetical protein
MTIEANQQASARQGRVVALVIAGAGILWLLANALGGYFGLPARFAILFDLMAIAAFFWALVVTYQIWRRQQAQTRNH